MKHKRHHEMKHEISFLPCPKDYFCEALTALNSGRLFHFFAVIPYSSLQLSYLENQDVI